MNLMKINQKIRNTKRKIDNVNISLTFKLTAEKKDVLRAQREEYLNELSELQAKKEEIKT